MSNQNRLCRRVRLFRFMLNLVNLANTFQSYPNSKSRSLTKHPSPRFISRNWLSNIRVMLMLSLRRDSYRIADLRAQIAVLRCDDLASACQAALAPQPDNQEVDNETIRVWSRISSHNLEWFHTSLCTWLRTPGAADSDENIEVLHWLLDYLEFFSNDMDPVEIDEFFRMEIDEFFRMAARMNPPLVLNPPWSTVRGHHSQNCRPLELFCAIPKPGTVGRSGRCQLRDEGLEELWTRLCKLLSVNGISLSSVYLLHG
ncbi:unnamed protein product [Symbiodinium sp. CCMP2456]|nr:unnamed protein product [Symbiodinium sp. CCMP2456]